MMDSYMKEAQREARMCHFPQHGQTPDSTDKNYQKGDKNLSKSR